MLNAGCRTRKRQFIIPRSSFSFILSILINSVKIRFYACPFAVSFNVDCADESRAMGTRNGEQLT